MQLEDYFDFLAPNDIRLKGHRIGIETILLDYLELGLFPEQIAVRYPTLTLEQIYATITYYWHNQIDVDAYLHAWKEHGQRRRAEQERNPPPAVRRLRERIHQREPATQTQETSTREQRTKQQRTERVRCISSG
ncbi:MAG: DUF433 domain-containing protein [Chloroflexaceae bacterium]